MRAGGTGGRTNAMATTLVRANTCREAGISRVPLWTVASGAILCNQRLSASVATSTTMRQTTAEADTIEHIAQEQLKFEIVFEEQARVLRANQARCDVAMRKIQQTPLVAKRGQHWEPTQDNADEYLAYCEDICRSVPQNFDELSLL
jgi:hypothetical protein